MTKFFISYTSADQRWAEWVGYVLEEEGFSVTIQAWDFRPGTNFVLEMHRAATEADRTIMVLSPDYLKSQFASPEWASAFVQDPQGLQRKLLPVLVRPCQPTGLLASLVHISIVGEDENAARRKLLEGLDEKRAKPRQRPPFPGDPDIRASKSFPGAAASLPSKPPPYTPNLPRRPTDADRRRFIGQTFATIQSYFQGALDQLAHHRDAMECYFQPNTATEFMAEVFWHGKSINRCRIWLGGLHARDGISYGEGHSCDLGNACNEILSVSDNQGELRLQSLMGVGIGSIEKRFDLKSMSPDDAAEYLWRRFVTPLER